MRTEKKPEPITAAWRNGGCSGKLNGSASNQLLCLPTV